MVVEDEMRGGPSPSVSWASPHTEGLVPRETLWGLPLGARGPLGQAVVLTGWWLPFHILL